MSLLVMLGCGIMFGIGHNLAPYIIMAYKARSIAKKAKKAKKKMQKKGEYIE